MLLPGVHTPSPSDCRLPHICFLWAWVLGCGSPGVCASLPLLWGRLLGRVPRPRALGEVPLSRPAGLLGTWHLAWSPSAWAGGLNPRGCSGKAEHSVRAGSRAHPAPPRRPLWSWLPCVSSGFWRCVLRHVPPARPACRERASPAASSVQAPPSLVHARLRPPPGSRGLAPQLSWPSP